MTFQAIGHWPNEHLQMDTDRLAEVYLKLGEKRALLAVSRAVEDLICVLDLLESQAQAGRRDAIGRTAERLEEVAIPLGLCSVAQVAADLRDASQRQDVACDAVIARLSRVTERSIEVLTRLQAEIS